MNERAVPPQEQEAENTSEKREDKPRRIIVTGSDREFLPAAIEILETPPPPMPVVMSGTICTFFAIALIWSYFGKLDVHAVAPGKIETISHAKVVQPFDNGKIAAIHVVNGAEVKSGEVVLELDPAEALADVEATRIERFENAAEVARRKYEVAVAEDMSAKEEDPKYPRGFERDLVVRAVVDAKDKIVFLPETGDSIKLRQRNVLAADLSQLVSELANIDKQIATKEATRERLGMSIAFENQLMGTLNDRVKTRQDAIDLKVGTKINLYDAKEELQKAQSQLASDQGQLIETEAGLGELRSQKFKALSQFIADNENKAVDATRKASDAEQSLAKANAKLVRMKLVAPIDGTVQQLSVTTIGQVVTTGQQLLVISPKQAQLQVEALVANSDIGFVKLGQTAVVKVDAFPFTRFGALSGKVVSIAPQAVLETEAKRSLADAASPSNGAPSPTTAPGQPESFVFPVTIALDRSNIVVDGRQVALNPGMTTTVEIKTDRRSVLSYFLSPLSKSASEALHER